MDAERPMTTTDTCPGYLFDRLNIFRDGRHPMLDGREIPLNYSEAAVLRTLAESQGDWTPCEALRAAIGTGSKTPLKVIVSTLRRKLRESGVPDRFVERGRKGAYRLFAETITQLPPEPGPIVPADPEAEQIDLAGLVVDLRESRILSQAGERHLPQSAILVLREIAWAAPRFIDPDEIAAAIEDITGQRPQRRAITFNVWQIRDAARQIGVHRLVDSRAKQGYRLASRA